MTHTDQHINRSSAIVQSKPRGRKAMGLVAAFWMSCAFIGQALFMLYVSVFYGGTALEGNYAQWNEVLDRGYIAGDGLSNSITAGHLVFAVFVMLFGPAQFIPKVRAMWPQFHRFNGRLYVASVCIASLTGLYMIWSRDATGDIVQALSISFNGLLIFVFAFIGVRYAIRRQIALHQEWMLRLFLVSSGVWFARVGFMMWMVLTGGIGLDLETMTGPFMHVVVFGQYILPLAVAELYFLAKRSRSNKNHWAMAGVLSFCTVVMCIGIFAATMGIWIPFMQK